MPDETKEFTPITTQADFDAAIAPRLQRERATAVKPFADYDDIKRERDTLRTDKDDLTAQLTDANAKIKRYEAASVKTRIAHDKGLPYEMAERLNGETEDEISADADRLVKIIGATHEPAAPLADTDMKNPGGLDSALQALANDLKI